MDIRIYYLFHERYRLEISRLDLERVRDYKNYNDHTTRLLELLEAIRSIEKIIKLRRYNEQIKTRT